MGLSAAYIVPHPPLAVAEVGKGEESHIAATLAAYREVAVRLAANRPDTIILISPHSAYYADWIYIAAGESARGDFSQFGAPQVSFDIAYDTHYREILLEEANRRSIPAGLVFDRAKELDHGLMVPLYFISQTLSLEALRFVSIGGSGLPSETLVEFGRCITRSALQSDSRCVLVASGDLSHKLKPDGPYGFDPAGPVFDKLFGEIVAQGQPLAFAEIDSDLSENAAECGLSGFIMLAGAIDESERLGHGRSASELLSLEGPFGVGYGIAAFEPVTSGKGQASHG